MQIMKKKKEIKTVRVLKSKLLHAVILSIDTFCDIISEELLQKIDTMVNCTTIIRFLNLPRIFTQNL